ASGSVGASPSRPETPQAQSRRLERWSRRVTRDCGAPTTAAPPLVLNPIKGAAMSEESFTDLIARVRGGDERAAADLVRRYEPEIRREVRFLLRDPFLRRTFDSMDICQSVMGSFFLRAALGEYDLDRPEDLIRLLISMTRNKVVDATRRQRAQRRDHRRATSLGALDIAASTPSPSQIVEGREMLAAFRGKLSDEE